MIANAIDPMAALGQILWLCAQTTNFGNSPVRPLLNGVWYSIEAGQFRIYRSAEGQPLACVTWGWLHKEHEADVIAAYKAMDHGVVPLKEEWLGGDLLWLSTFVAPFGHAKDVALDLRHNVFPNVRSARAVRIDKHGKPRSFAVFRNGRAKAATSGAVPAVDRI
ncbi:toxin-activating lysine-acyltransferase [Alkalilimnicola sp. S0819]|uniref:toxin-activating lysine-acyltransferase n=1 Tax=Alkalilimnicola sp. S0819 TaxID=2613922 RepID=UPI0012629FAF|nr:toxin-activating lysine-acyltransferase [Alkalilimnicola sp. S0819]KAB7627150.1 toxin-activating lysine-acyltransferase [Alkalilimnicola sp. S0819]MPQ15859.1 toxin-activating lysine-acyltransferase [Alkalilimnicola sp. S0819]